MLIARWRSTGLQVRDWNIRVTRELETPVTLQNAQIPVGGVFTSSHFGAGAMYRASVSQSQGQLGNGIQGNMTVSVRVVAFVHLLSKGRQMCRRSRRWFPVCRACKTCLTRLGIAATTPQQISDLLQQRSRFASARVGERSLAEPQPWCSCNPAVTLNWSGRGASRQQLYLSFLYNSNEMPSSTQQSAILRRHLFAPVDGRRTPFLPRIRCFGANPRE